MQITLSIFLHRAPLGVVYILAVVDLYGAALTSDVLPFLSVTCASICKRRSLDIGERHCGVERAGGRQQVLGVEQAAWPVA